MNRLFKIRRLEVLLLFVVGTSTIYSQSKVEWFFSDIENKELLSVETKEQINPELETMVSNYNKLFKDNLIKKEVSVVSETSFDKSGYTKALLSMNNPTASDEAYLRRGFTQKYYDSKFIPRTINVNKVIKRQTPEWGEIVKYYGGYSKLSEKGIDKSKIKDFELTTTLESIQFTEDGNSTDVLVKISGSEQSLSYYNITENKLKSKGNYKLPTITYIDINKLSKYIDKEMNDNDTPKVEFTFTDKSLEKEKLNLNLVFGSDVKILVDDAVKINNVMSQMIDDLIPYEFYSSLSSKILESEEKLKKERLSNTTWVRNVTTGPQIMFLCLKFFSNDTYSMDAYWKIKKRFKKEMVWVVYKSVNNEWSVPKVNKYNSGVTDDYIMMRIPDEEDETISTYEISITDDCCIDTNVRGKHVFGTFYKPSNQDLLLLKEIEDSVK